MTAAVARSGFYVGVNPACGHGRASVANDSGKAHVASAVAGYIKRGYEVRLMTGAEMQKAMTTDCEVCRGISQVGVSRVQA